jgi:hypothetical protein
MRWGCLLRLAACGGSSSGSPPDAAVLDGAPDSGFSSLDGT